MCVIDRLATQELQYNMNIVEGGKQAEPSSRGPPAGITTQPSERHETPRQREGEQSSKSVWLGHGAQPSVYIVTSSKKRLNYMRNGSISFICHSSLNNRF